MCNTCKSTTCGCALRYKGVDKDCIGIATEQTYDSVVEILSDEICALIETISGFKSVDHTSFTSSTGTPSNISKQQGEVDTYTVWGDLSETINLGTFGVYNGIDGINGVDGVDGADGVDGIDANTNYQNVLWVDKTNGDDGTAQVGRFDLPYLSYASARTAASSGDLIWFRKGIHTEEIILKDGVDIHFDTGSTLVGGIIDNGVAATCKIFGDFNISKNTNNAVYITATGSDVSFEGNTIDCVGTVVGCSPPVGTVATLKVKVKRIIGTSINYFVRGGGTANLTIEVSEYCETAADTQAFSGITLRSFDGKLDFRTPLMIIRNSTTSDDGGHLIYEDNLCTGGTSKIDIGEVISEYNYITPNTDGTIHKVGNGKIFLNLDKVSCQKRPLIVNTGSNSNGLIVIKGRLYCDQDIVLKNEGTGKVVFRDSSLHRGDGGSDLNQVIVSGNVAGYTFTSNTENYTELINTSVIKTSAGTDTTGGLIARGDGANIRVFSRDSIFITKGTFTGEVVSSATASTPDNDFYFNNCRSNNPTLSSAAITQKEAGGAGITVNDTYLDTYDYTG